MNFKSRKTAMSVMIVMIVIAIIYGGGRSIEKDIHKIETIYNDQILNELNNQETYASQLITLAMQENNIQQEFIQNLQDDLNTLNQVANIDEKYDAFQNLQSSFLALKLEMENTSLSNERERVFTKIYQNFNSSYELIMRSAQNYNLAAESLNKKLDRFPASMIKKISGKGNAPLFA